MKKLICFLVLISALFLAVSISIAEDYKVEDINYAYLTCPECQIPVNEPITWTLLYDGPSRENYTFEYSLYYRPYNENSRTYTLIDSVSFDGYSFTKTIETEGRYLIFLRITDSQNNSIDIDSNYYTTIGENYGEALQLEIASIKAECIASGATTDAEIARFMHDYIINHAEYNMEASCMDDPEGVLINGEGVCQSYAYAYQLLLKSMGIECILIDGYTVQNFTLEDQHIWNLVNIDGKWYHVDCCFDDPLDSVENQSCFLVTDKIRSGECVWTASVYPKCQDGSFLPCDILLSDENDFESQMNIFAAEGKFDGLIVMYIGSDELFSTTKLQALMYNWQQKYKEQYNIDGTAIWREAEGMAGDGYFRYLISFAVMNETDVDDYYDGIYESFAYSRISDGIKIVEYLGNEAFVVIPEQIENTPVTHIGNAAFWKNSTITNITIPNTVVQIDDGSSDTYFYRGYCGAFKECTNLQSINIPGSVVRVGRNAFMGCTSLSNVTLNEGTQILAIDCFAQCSSLSTLVLPSTLTTFAQNVIDGTRIASLHLPKSVIDFNGIVNDKYLQSVTVEDGNPVYSAWDGVLYRDNGSFLCYYPVAKADTSYSIREGCSLVWTDVFMDATNLETLVIPSTFQGFVAFGIYPVSLSSIIVSPDNPYYVSIDGIVYSCDMTKLICIPPSLNIETYVMPDTVTSKTDYALRNLQYIKRLEISKDLYTNYQEGINYCPLLEEVIYQPDGSQQRILSMQTCPNLRYVQFPSNAKVIPFNAFYQCESISQIDLPEGLDTIDQQAFCQCTSLKSIHIPSSVTTIGVNAFMDCGIEVIYMDAIPAYFAEGAFGDGNVIVVSENESMREFAEGQGYHFSEGAPSKVIINNGIGKAYRCNFQPEEITLNATFEPEGTFAFVYYDIPESVDQAIVWIDQRDGEWILIPRNLGSTVITGSTSFGDVFQFEIEVLCHHTWEYYDLSPATQDTNGKRGQVQCRQCSVHLDEKDISHDSIMELPTSLTTIEDEAFRGVSAQQINIPSSTTRIGRYAFSDCTNLALIIIPDSVTEIAPDAFSGSSDVLILCDAGSYAEIYAFEYGIPYVSRQVMIPVP
ncbi:MAG: leucine-rich repeat protein [Clostridia bacterium]|nr:leucine-rich repeat protein [Clostridia bacterium]